MDDIVKYHNDLSDLGLRGFSAVELDLLMTLISRFREQSTTTVKLDFVEIKDIVQLKKGMTTEEFTNTLMSMNKKLLGLSMFISTEEKTVQFTLFNDFTIYHKEKSLEASINKTFSYLINDLTGNFTRFELEQYVNLKSTYSKELFRLLKRFKDTGFWKVTIDDFRKLLDIPDSYRMSEIDKHVLGKAIPELSKYFSALTVEKIKSRRRGSPVTRLEFHFKTSKREDRQEIEVLPGQVTVDDLLQGVPIDEIKTLVKNASGADISDEYAIRIYTILQEKGRTRAYLEEILAYSKERDINNFQGWLLSMVRKFEPPKSKNGNRKSGFTDYEQRETDYKKVEKEMLGIHD